MSFFKTLGKIGSAFLEEAKEQQKVRMRDNARTTSAVRKEIPTIGGKTLRQWEGEWRYLGTLDHLDLSSYSRAVGLYKAELGGKVMYVGRAVEHSNGGLRKRLSDYTRESDSARKHTSGQLMNANASDLKISVLVVGNDEDAATVSKQLERHFIKLYSPEWNTMFT